MILTLQLHPLLGVGEVAGWDLTMHRAWCELMSTFLRSGTVSGYDFQQLGGIPAFALYPPLFYIVVALPTVLTAELIPVQVTFNLAIFALPFVFILLLRNCAVVLWGASAAPWAVILGLLYQCIDRRFAAQSLGIHGAISMGNVVSAFGNVLILGLIGSLLLARGRSNLRSVLAPSMWLAAIFLSHTMSSVAALLILGGLVCLNGVPKRVLFSVPVALGLSAWWLPRFLQHLPYNSATPAGGLWMISDPLLALFPSLTPAALRHLFTVPSLTPGRFVSDGIQSAELYLFLNFPWSGVVFLTLVLLGVRQLLTSRWHSLLWIYLIAIVFLPRDLLVDYQDGAPSLHYYRFLQPIWSLHLLVAISGGVALTRMVAAMRHRQRLITAGLSLISVVTLSITCLYQFGVGRAHNDDFFGIWPSHWLTAEYPEDADAQKIITFIRTGFESGELRGRVVAETNSEVSRRIGSPHYFSSNAELRNAGVSFLTGLFVESSTLAPFINPLLASHTNHLTWGRTTITALDLTRNLSVDQMVERLRWFGVGTVVTTSGRALTELSLSSALRKTYASGAFRVFTLPDPAPLIESPEFKPFLYMAEGGRSFESVTEANFGTESSWRIPIVTDPKGELPPERIASDFSGIIVSRPPGLLLREEEVRQWATRHPRVIFIDTVCGQRCSTTPNAEQTSGSFQCACTGPGELRGLSNSLQSILPRFASAAIGLKAGEPNPTVLTPGSGTIVLDSRHPTTIRFGYSPLWWSSDGSPILPAGPHGMYVGNSTPITLSYH
jgi:hypothetical protein